MEPQGSSYRIEGRPATIFRTVKNKDNPFVMIDQRPLLNPAMSWKAKGILTYLMSRPDGWEVSVADLVNRSTDGKASVRAGLQELRDAGHMRYSVSRDQGRITGWIIEVYEVPTPENSLQPEFDFRNVAELDDPQSEKPCVDIVQDTDFRSLVDVQDTDFQEVENRTQVLMDLNNIKSINDNESAEPTVTTTETRPGIFSLYEKSIGMIPQLLADELTQAGEKYPAEWQAKAFQVAVENDARNWAYVRTVLENMQTHGPDWKPGKPGESAKQARYKTSKPKGSTSQPDFSGWNT